MLSIAAAVLAVVVIALLSLRVRDLRTLRDARFRAQDNVRDITERDRIEAGLRDAAEFVQAVEDSILDHLAVLDPGGVIVAVNAAWRRFAQENNDDGVLPTLRDDVGTNYVDICRAAARQAPEAGEVAEGIVDVLAGRTEMFAHEYACHSPDRVQWFCISVTPLRTATGGAVVVHSDITKRKRDEAELQQHRDHLEKIVAHRSAELLRANAALSDAEAFLRTVADNLPGRVAYWTADTLCGFVNQTYCDWFGKTREELIGRSMEDIFGPTFFARRAARVRAVLAGEAQHFERDEQKADGEWAYASVHYIPDRHEGRVRGFFVLANDFTAMKRNELQLQLVNQQLSDARDVAEAATHAKSAFLANMSHEIRTPMNAIIGLTHLLRREVHEPAPLARLAKVSDAAHHLLDVINDILDLSKIESGKLRLHPTDFAVDAMLSRACSLVADQARAKGLELVIATDDLPPVIHGDATRIAQALLNLLSNAVKFTERGSVTLRAAWIDRQAPTLNVRFEVHDTGIGIAADRMGALFTAFEQADGSTTRRYGGTGLGLAITRQLAQLMGGQSGVDSAPGVGSRFWFTAVLARATEPSRATRRGEVAGLRGLLTDDLPEAREALAHMLRQQHVQVDVAASGEETLALADAAAASGNPYDFHIIDWKMDGIDGIETARRLRQRPDRQSPPCVLVSAHDQDSLWRDARAAGIGRVLIKPVSASALHDALVEAMSGGTALATSGEQGRSGVANFDALRETRGGARILLAEDNVVNQEVALELLRSAGLEVDVAVDGSEAVAKGERGGYDLILMDVQMPEIDGLQATRMLRATLGGAHVPIVAMTANAFSEDRQACLAAGMNDHVAKPVDPEALYGTLLRWLPAPVAAAPARQGAPPVAPAPKQPPDVSPSATPTTMDPRSRLASIDGLDIVRGLRPFGGMMDVYIRVLGLFVDLYAKGMPQLDEAIAAGDVDRMAAAAHSLRGASSSIGATHVEELSGLVESLGRSGAASGEVSAAAVDAQQALEALVERLAPALAELAEPADDAPPGTPPA